MRHLICRLLGHNLAGAEPTVPVVVCLRCKRQWPEGGLVPHVPIHVVPEWWWE